MSQSANVSAFSPRDEMQILTVQGELDLATADGLYERGRAAIACRARLLLLDLAGLSFCDACGLSALVRIANEAEAAGCRYGLVAPQPLLVKMLRITGLNARLPVFATMEEARQRLMAPAETPAHAAVDSAGQSSRARNHRPRRPARPAGGTTTTARGNMEISASSPARQSRVRTQQAVDHPA